VAKVAEFKGEIAELYQNGEGMTRAQIVKQLKADHPEELSELTYQDVFRYTKAASGQTAGEGAANRGRGRIMIQDPETGEDVSRVDYIRRLHEDGMTRGQIVKELAGLGQEVSFQIVYAATAPPKVDEDGNPIVREPRVAKAKTAKAGKKSKQAQVATQDDVDSMLEDPDDDSLFPDADEEAVG
jgi:hypothetical protein